MEQGRLLFRIFLMIMMVGFVGTFIIFFRMFLFFNFIDFQDFTIYQTIFSIITFIVNPVSVLVGFYYLGKKFDLKSNLKWVIIRLLIGAYLGQFFAITVVNLIGIYFINGFSFYWTSYLSNILSTLFLAIFFSAFTALAIAYLRNNREETDEV